MNDNTGSTITGQTNASNSLSSVPPQIGVVLKSAPGLVGNNITTPATTTTIPQEIATMSEHDLISYINPQCFEQGKNQLLN